IDEKVRHANTKLADLHLVASEEARERVIRLGEDPRFVINTGCASIDLAQQVSDAPLSFDPIEKYGGVGATILPKDQYLVVMQHPVTNEYEKAKEDVTKTLEVISDSGLPTFWFWPNVDSGADGTSKGIRTFRELKNPKNIRFFKNMEPHDFLCLLNHSAALVGNSSVGIRECGYLGIPVVNIGTRQHNRQRGHNVIDVDYDKKEIANAIQECIKSGKKPRATHFGNGKAGRAIAEVLATAELRYHKTITY
ncbi:MAG: UDP-N-acetylglucosamine 2-epimerase, partial [Leeuwenhoekiella sp.]